MKNTLKYSLLNGFGAAAYVIVIASLIYFLGESSSPVNNNVLIPIAMLLLFVFSAAFTGALVFGRPIMWYLDGKKKEALSLLFYTLGIFLLITILTFIIMILIIM